MPADILLTEMTPSVIEIVVLDMGVSFINSFGDTLFLCGIIVKFSLPVAKISFQRSSNRAWFARLKSSDPQLRAALDSGKVTPFHPFTPSRQLESSKVSPFHLFTPAGVHARCARWTPASTNRLTK